eukprot:5907986-Pyramimonas_sp.AAC.1
MPSTREEHPAADAAFDRPRGPRAAGVMLEKGGMQTSLIYTQIVRPSVATLERMTEGWMRPKAFDPGISRIWE